MTTATCLVLAFAFTLIFGFIGGMFLMWVMRREQPSIKELRMWAEAWREWNLGQQPLDEEEDRLYVKGYKSGFSDCLYWLRKFLDGDLTMPPEA